MSEQSAQERNSAGSVGRVIFVVLTVYVLCPPIFIVPLKVVYGKRTPPPVVVKTVRAFMAPSNLLYTRVPAYRMLRDKEAALLGLR